MPSILVGNDGAASAPAPAPSPSPAPAKQAPQKKKQITKRRPGRPSSTISTNFVPSYSDMAARQEAQQQVNEYWNGMQEIMLRAGYFNNSEGGIGASAYSTQLGQNNGTSTASNNMPMVSLARNQLEASQALPTPSNFQAVRNMAAANYTIGTAPNSQFVDIRHNEPGALRYAATSHSNTAGSNNANINSSALMRKKVAGISSTTKSKTEMSQKSTLRPICLTLTSYPSHSSPRSVAFLELLHNIPRITNSWCRKNGVNLDNSSEVPLIDQFKYTSESTIVFSFKSFDENGNELGSGSKKNQTSAPLTPVLMVLGASMYRRNKSKPDQPMEDICQAVMHFQKGRMTHRWTNWIPSSSYPPASTMKKHQEQFTVDQIRPCIFIWIMKQFLMDKKVEKARICVLDDVDALHAKDQQCGLDWRHDCTHYIFAENVCHFAADSGW